MKQIRTYIDKAKQYCTPKIAADALGVSPDTVRRWLNNGDMRGFKFPHSHWCVLAEDVEDRLVGNVPVVKTVPPMDYIVSLIAIRDAAIAWNEADSALSGTNPVRAEELYSLACDALQDVVGKHQANFLDATFSD